MGVDWNGDVCSTHVEKRDRDLAVGELEERDHVEDLDVNGRKTLNGC
jgi:hypothetical protein